VVKIEELLGIDDLAQIPKDIMAPKGGVSSIAEVILIEDKLK